MSATDPPDPPPKCLGCGAPEGAVCAPWCKGEQRGRFVDTPYGALPGCPDCDVIPLTTVHVCEHGVTPPPAVVLDFSIRFDLDPIEDWRASKYAWRARDYT